MPVPAPEICESASTFLFFIPYSPVIGSVTRSCLFYLLNISSVNTSFHLHLHNCTLGHYHLLYGRFLPQPPGLPASPCCCPTVVRESFLRAYLIFTLSCSEAFTGFLLLYFFPKSVNPFLPLAAKARR